MYEHTRMKSAFTLVELAIVIVIIGLLVGGVMQGQELIRQARITNFASTMQQYKTSIVVFKSKYNSYPGDTNKATVFFGTTSPAGATIINGVQNNIIENNNERYQAWLHLALANMIKQGQGFTGVSGPGGGGVNHSIPGTNVPSFLDNVGLTFYNASVFSPTACDNNWYCQTYGNVFMFGKPAPSYLTYVPIFTPAEAWQVDTKLDDGRPATGIIMGWRPNPTGINPNCTTSTDEQLAEYKLSVDGVYCSGLYKLEL